MKNSLRTLWRWVKWPVLVLVFLYAVLVGTRVFVFFDRDNTAQAVAFIHAQKLTLADVTGDTMIRKDVDQATYDATVEGIDSNNNGIRDDVEIAIWKKYPNSAKVRAAELQYAMAIQLMLTKVYNTETWVAAAEEGSRAYGCISQTYSRVNLPTYIKVTGARTKEVEALVLNTDARRNAQVTSDKFTTSYSLPNENLCNIDLSTLSN